MKKAISYITQKNVLNPIENEVIEVTKRVVDDESDLVVTKRKLDKKVLETQLSQIEAGIKKMTERRDKIVTDLEAFSRESKKQPSIVIDTNPAKTKKVKKEKEK